MFAVTCVVDGCTSIVLVYQKSMKIQNGSAAVWLLCLQDNITVVTKECTKMSGCFFLYYHITVVTKFCKKKCSDYSCN